MKNLDRDVRMGVTIMACGFIGIVFAGLEKLLYDKGVIIDEFITGSIALTDLMAITIIMWLLIGGIIAVVTS